METLIRLVRSSDRDLWLGLRAELWPDHPRAELEHEVDSFFRTGKVWSYGGQPGQFRVWLAESPDVGAVGFLEASLRPFADGCRTGPVGYLEGWFVRPERRRQGVGGALVRAAEEWARSLGCTQMASDAHLENAVSAASHQALGYEAVLRSVHFRKTIG
ncbi:MAG TPA: GNAT family N-acetyltransferase [Thermoplasmata archaeon]|nr:GNAT family N-acetyltransferase [Thermoplasmata archaeon]